MQVLMKGLLLCGLLFFVGLVNSLPEKYEELSKSMDISVTSNEANLHTRLKRALPSSNSRLWTFYNEEGDWIIPYVIRQDQQTVNPITNMLNGTDLMLQAITDYHENSCIRFRPRTTEKRYLTIRFLVKEGAGCGTTTVGESPHYTHIEINLLPGCQHIRAIRRQLFHKLMFINEQYRPDRDDYVISLKNQDVTTMNDYGNVTLTTGYDIFSISHSQSFILKYKNERGWKYTPQLSYDDIESLNMHYNCPRPTAQKRNCDVVPTVNGNGEVYPLQTTYKHKQGVRLICENGYQPDDEHYSYCEDGEFVPNVLKCKKAKDCEDLVPSRICRMIIARVPGFCILYIADDICTKSCGYCASDVWGMDVCTKLPTLIGSGFMGSSYEKGLDDIYWAGKTLHVYCNDGYFPVGPTSSTCINGAFNVTTFQCVPLKTPKYMDLLGSEKVEGGKRACQRFYPHTCVTLPDVHIDHGRFYHHEKNENYCPFFYNNDYAVLKCDRGYQPVSSPLAQCRINQATNKPEWSHTKLECVRIPANQNGCATPPVFNRKRSSIAPLKFRYEFGEQVNITCHPGYRLPMGSWFTATCMQDGQFDNNLFQFCQEGLLSYWKEIGYCNNDYLQNYPIGEHDKYPIMDFYPHGFKIKLRCLTTGNYDRLHGRNHDILECDASRWSNWNWHGINCNSLTYCTGDQLYSDSYKIYVRPQPWNSTWNFNTLYENGIAEGESIKIDCGFGFEPMTATCIKKRFRYKNVCNFKRTVEIATTERSCKWEELPQLHGEGRFYPNKTVYRHMEEVVMKCGQGFTSVTNSGFQCINGKFSVDSLICASDECTDDNDCTQDSCEDEQARERCRLTCGLCEGDGCFIDSIGVSNTVAVSPKKSVYRHGESVTATCASEKYNKKGNYLYTVTSRCLNGYFDKPMPWCLNSDQESMKRLGDKHHFPCSVFSDECFSNEVVRSYCAFTCFQIIGDKDWSFLNWLLVRDR